MQVLLMPLLHPVSHMLRFLYLLLTPVIAPKLVTVNWFGFPTLSSCDGFVDPIPTFVPLSSITPVPNVFASVHLDT